MKAFDYVEAFKSLPCYLPKQSHVIKYNSGNTICIICRRFVHDSFTFYEILERRKENANLRLVDGDWIPYSYGKRND